MFEPATNRQKKVLQFFGYAIHPRISKGAAGWEISVLFEDEQHLREWEKYVYLTKDFDSDSPELKPFDPEELRTLILPTGWSLQQTIGSFNEELVANLLRDQSPFDNPQPAIVFAGKSFIFTGTFEFGARELCQEAVRAKGGEAPDKSSISQSLDYLVVGTKGSKAWKKGAYGNKIESAILKRRQFGTPAIIMETHWAGSLK